jgi:hypothetical protein
MSSRRVRVVVLCEGLKDYWFAYRCLRTCGWREDQITVNYNNRGSGFDHVLSKYPVEVRANRQGTLERELLVMIDADEKPGGAREKQLNERLRNGGQPQRRPGDRIALWVPRRQLETWVYFLQQGTADEVTDYKRAHLVKDKEYKTAARKFAQMLKQRRPLSEATVPSMRKAATEFDRLRTKPGKEASRKKPSNK